MYNYFFKGYKKKVLVVYVRNIRVKLITISSEKFIDEYTFIHKKQDFNFKKNSNAIFRLYVK